MAAFIKIKGDNNVYSLMAHNQRSRTVLSNPDIDHNRSDKNIDIIERVEKRGMSDYSYYKKRLSEIYQYGKERKDLVKALGFVSHVPKDLPPEQQKKFFAYTYMFLCEKFGRENICQAVIHLEEATPHLHAVILPVTALDESKKFDQKQLEKGYTEKLNAAGVINRQMLRDFHPEYREFLRNRGIDANVNSGITREQGGNRTVAQLKAERNRDVDIDRWR
ncbi:MAG: plasmid recombination protein [Lachnospiraceae bacterium]|nr:plasmid recombination protein [Lachnospiraceae bacterium]